MLPSERASDPTPRASALALGRFQLALSGTALASLVLLGALVAERLAGRWRAPRLDAPLAALAEGDERAWPAVERLLRQGATAAEPLLEVLAAGPADARPHAAYALRRLAEAKQLSPAQRARAEELLSAALSELALRDEALEGLRTLGAVEVLLAASRRAEPRERASLLAGLPALAEGRQRQVISAALAEASLLTDSAEVHQASSEALRQVEPELSYALPSRVIRWQPLHRSRTSQRTQIFICGARPSPAEAEIEELARQVKARLNRGELSEARPQLEALLRRARELGVARGEHLELRAELLGRLGELRRADGELTRLLRREPERMDLLLRRGLIRSAGGDAAGAAEDLRRAARLAGPRREPLAAWCEAEAARLSR